MSAALDSGAHSTVELNRVATRIDHLGRHLDGFDWGRDREIGACLTAAVSELASSRAEAERVGHIRGAVHQLEAALSHLDEGLRPEPPGPYPVDGS